MISIDEQIHGLIQSLGKEYNILKYVYNKDFVEGVTPVYYSGPYWGNDEVTEAIKSLLTGNWLSSGENVKLFENKLVKKINSKYGVMVNSGSSANLILIASVKKFLNWSDNDEVITSVVGFPTTVAPLIQNNLKPVFIDIEMDSLNFDLNLIEKKITSKTKAIFLSPVLGNPPDMDVLLNMCNKHGITLLLDNCDSLGSKWNGKYLNEYSFASSNSFYPAHHISTGEGGMVVSDDKELIKLARSMSWWGRDCYCVGSCNLLPHGTCGNRFDTWLEGYDEIIDHKYVFTNIGYNLKPLDMQGSIGCVQMEKFDEIHDKRKNSKNTLSEIFERYIKDIHIPKELPSAETSWFGTPIVCESKQLKQKIVGYLEKKKIQTRNYFAGNLLMHPGYKHLDNYLLYPEANKVLDLVFFIGAAPHYTNEVFEYVEKIMKDYN